MFYWSVTEESDTSIMRWSQNFYDPIYETEEECLKGCYQKIADMAHKGCEEYKNPKKNITIKIEKDSCCPNCKQDMTVVHRVIEYSPSMIEGIKPTEEVAKEVAHYKRTFFQKIIFSIFGIGR